MNLKFWKKDNYKDDFSDLTKFGLDEKEFSSTQGAPDSSRQAQSFQDSAFSDDPFASASSAQQGAQQSFPSPQYPSQQSFPLPQHEEQPSAFSSMREQRAQPSPLPAQHAPLLDSRDVEMINLKLDSIRATLENINTRLSRLEHLASGQQQYKW